MLSKYEYDKNNSWKTEGGFHYDDAPVINSLGKTWTNRPPESQPSSQCQGQTGANFPGSTPDVHRLPPSRASGYLPPG